ncbi:MAG: hypothetical protein COB99_01050 [Sulfurimonas sp.]|nr:MAG: hypothetical protein COB99_01050 [Sulfurimonas sp.]
MNNNLTDKQQIKKKLEKRQTRLRVSKYRANKKDEDSKLIQFYIGSADKNILDEYKALKKQTTSEVFKELINQILARRLKNSE